MPIFTKPPAREVAATLVKKYDHLFKIVLIGKSGSGKSCLLRRYCDNTFNESFISTIGVDFQSKLVTVRNKVCNLQVWDTSGQERFRTITSSYYRGAKGVIMVYDCQDPEALKELDYWLSQAKRYCGENIPMMIVGNKIDLPSEVPAQQVKAFAEKHNCLFMETSAKTGTNVQEAFERLCDACVGHIGQLYEFKDDNAIMLNKGESRSWCCSH